MFNRSLIAELRAENVRLLQENEQWQASYKKLVDRLLTAQGIPEKPQPEGTEPSFNLWEEEGSDSVEMEDNRIE